MFRYDRPGRGRYRQFNQFGVEVLGDSEPELDAEVIAVAWGWLRELALQGTSLQLNSIGDAECRPRYRDALLQHFEPHLQQLPELDQARLRRNPLRILDSKELGTEALLATAPRTVDFLCDGCREAFERVVLALDAYEIPYQLAPRLVRGLDYYVRTAFEVWHESLQGAQNALFGGGRYDGLSELVGYPPAPGVGFAAGLERVVMLAPPAPPARGPQVAVISAQPAAAAAVISASESLRALELAVVSDPGRRSLKAKMRAAERAGISVVVILGESEVARKVATVRRLRDGAQQEVSQEELGQTVGPLLGEEL
jgi:histidyl-tRNA synthetase